MSEYTRSRSKLSGNYSGDRDGPSGSGGGRTNIVLIAVIVIAIIVVVVVVASIIKGKMSPVNGTPTTDPSATVESTPIPTDSPLPEDTASTSPTDTVNPDDSASTAPSDTVNPDDSASTAPSDTTDPDNSATPDPDKSSSPGEKLSLKDITGTATGVTTDLPMHASASATSTTLKSIKKDETFTVLAVSSKAAWLKVKYDDKTGYVLAKYVTIGESSSTKVCTVTSTSVHVRSSASKTKDTNIIGDLKSGDTVIVKSTVTAGGIKWYKIEVGDSTGYVSAQFCRICTK
jgi:hypothetical protein